MKVINHQKGNHSYLGDSVMNGTIEMTPLEFGVAVEYLRRQFQYANMVSKTYVRDSLRHVFDYTLATYDGNGTPVCLGVCATELIFKKFNLPRYKRQNYQVIVKA